MNTWSETIRVGEHALQRYIFLAFMISAPLGMLTAAIEGIYIGGKPISGYSWVIQSLLAAVALMVCRRRTRFLCPFWLWVPWMLWIVLRCNWQDFYSVQRTLMMLSPIIIGIVAANVFHSRREIEWLLESLVAVVVVLIVFFVTSVLLESLPFGLRFQIEASGMTLFLAAAYFSIRMLRRKRRDLVLYLACLAICSVYTLRMDTLACLLAPAICPLGPKRSRKLHVLVLCGLLAVIVFSLPSMRRKMSVRDVSPATNIGDMLKALNTSGRAYVWGVFWEELVKNPVWGYGGNAAGKFGEENIRDKIDWVHPHNEYIRVVFNYGIVGLVLLGVPVLHLIHTARRSVTTHDDDTMRNAWAVVFTGLVLACIVSFTDNALLNIQFYGNFLFCLAGAVWGLSSSVPSVAVNRRGTFSRWVTRGRS